MNALAATAQAPSPAPAQATPQLRTLLLTDLVDSTGTVERLGDAPAAELFRAHDRLVLDLQQRWRGRLIDRSDGLLLLFERAIDGLGFALDYHRGLRELGKAHGVPLQARAGLHVGEVLTWRNSAEAVAVGAKPLEVEGLAKPLAGRLLGLARPGQILLSATAEALAHRAARELGERGAQLAWKSHGRWRFKGLPEPLEVYEAGEPGLAPLQAPRPDAKAWRDIPAWRRPAALAAELALAAVVGFAFWFFTRPQPAIAFAERDWVVVADMRNLTGQPVLDDALQQAFRISLEQSRHVNVLSDLKARDTLARMQRPPDTALDRAVASEIAVRDGARAVILPTVAEVGGRVRVSAEVIDPQSQTTVYAEYADGSGLGSVLASVDAVTAALRGRLGEEIKMIERESVPLAKVSTENLEALRAYSLGLKAHGQGDLLGARAFFETAIELDPHFALAYLGIARVFYNQADSYAARPYLDKAAEFRASLPPKEAMHLDAWLAEARGDNAEGVLRRWGLLAKLYPDYHAAHANYAWRSFQLGRYPAALDSARRAANSVNPLEAIALDQVGRAHLALEDYEAALRYFDKNQSITGQVPRFKVAALAAMRRFEQGEQYAGKGAEEALLRQFERISMAADQGNFKLAKSYALRAASKAEQSNRTVALNFKAIDLIVRSIDESDLPASVEYKDYFGTLLEDIRGARGEDRAAKEGFALAVLYTAMRTGAQLDRGQLRDLNQIGAQSADVRVRQMQVLVKAQELLRTGDSESAIDLVEPLIKGDELFQARVTLRDSYEKAKKHEKALEQNRWIARHRGRAYAELFAGFALQAANAVETNKAHLHAARTYEEIGEKSKSTAQLEKFRQLWPNASTSTYLRRNLTET